MFDKMISKMATSSKKVIIIGAGFGGIRIAKALNKTAYDVTLIDKNNYHLFQPLLYQVATAGLETGHIAYPVRRILHHMKNVHFRWGEVTHIDTEKNILTLHTPAHDEHLSYDILVLATGTTTNFFNFEAVKGRFMSLKSISEALDFRSYILQNLELAVMEESETKKAELLNIAIVGGGPTGVEMAGALAEMKRHVLPKDYPELNIDRMQISLFQRSDRVLEMLDPSLSEKAMKYLQGFGVNVHLNTAVTDYDGDNLILNGTEKFPTDTVIWAAGVKAVSPVGLNEAKVYPNGRVDVDEYNRITGYQNIYAIGDLACMCFEPYPKGHPQVAPVAIFQAEQLAQNLKNELKGKPWQKFVYKDKGSMAVVGRNKAVVQINKMRFGGFFAWIVWMVVHLLSLVGFRNKIRTLFSWISSYIFYDRALRLIVRVYNRRLDKKE